MKQILDNSKNVFAQTKKSQGSYKTYFSHYFKDQSLHSLQK